MASLINPYFHKDRTSEQNIINKLNKEAIQIMGYTYYYLPRDVQIEDLIFGEDVVSKFTLAIPIEMYLDDAQGFTGDKEMFSKFGLELNNSYKLVVNKERWIAEVKTKFDNDLTNGEASFDIVNYVRPREGDLIFDPITKYLLEIKFVDHDVEFYALGKNYQYYLSCEAFQYQQEELSTGVPDIDIFSDKTTNSINSLNNQILMENGAAIVLEQGGYLILDKTTNSLNNQILMENGAAIALEQGGHLILEDLEMIREYGTDFNIDADKIHITVINPFA